jgi:fatty-acyl-CoA synthase
MWANREAVVDGGLRFTYRQLAAAVQLASMDLHEHGVRSGDRVAHLGRLSAVHSILLFACARLGAVYVPIDVWAAWPAVQDMLTRVEPRVFVLGHSPMGRPLIKQLPAKHDARPLSTIDATDCGWALPNDISEIPEFTAADSDRPDRPHVILFTSGSTGEPKPLVYSQSGVAGQGLLMALALHTSPTDRFLNVFPAGHFGSLIPTMQLLGVGGSVIQVPLPEATQVFQAIASERPTYMVATPHLWRSLLKDRRAAETDWSCLRIANVASDTIPLDLLEQVMDVTGAISIQGYGLTEAGLVTLLPHSEARTRIGSAGLALPLCEVRIASETGAPALEGETGVIHVRSPFGACGIWRAGEVVSLDYTDDGFWATGDLGEMREGYLTVTGRVGTVLKVSGFRISVAELERVLSAHPAVRDCAVIGIAHAVLGEAPAAVIVIAEGGEVRAEELRAWVVRHLQPRAAPVAFRQAVAIPRTPGSGKIRRKQVFAEWESGTYPVLE